MVEWRVPAIHEAYASSETGCVTFILPSNGSRTQARLGVPRAAPR